MVPTKARPSPVVARVALARGKVRAITKDGESRTLLLGAPVYALDTLETGN